jgi:hypothetical protein
MLYFDFPRTYLYTELHILNSSGVLIIAVKQRTKCRFHTASILFKISIQENSNVCSTFKDLSLHNFTNPYYLTLE